MSTIAATGFVLTGRAAAPRFRATLSGAHGSTIQAPAVRPATTHARSTQARSTVARSPQARMPQARTTQARSTVARSTQASGSQLRLTRRGRATVSLVAGAVALTGLLSAQSAAAGGGEPAVQVTTHTVGAGETLWGIAARIAGPGEDVRDVVAQLAALNGLSGSALLAGQQLLVPAS